LNESAVSAGTQNGYLIEKTVSAVLISELTEAV
jgi:hypothetical protein